MFFANFQTDEKPTYELVRVTPEMAMTWLDKCNTRNRTTSNLQIKKYLNEMEEGRWKPNPVDPITFSKNGTLLNGQHRLKALVQYGFPLDMYVCYNVQEDIFDIIDKGKKRSIRDIFYIETKINTNILPAIINRYLALKDNTPTARTTSAKSSKTWAYPHQTILEEYYKKEAFYNDLTLWTKSLSVKSCFPAAVLGGLVAYLVNVKKHNYEYTINFFETLLLGSEYEMFRYVKRRIDTERKQARLEKHTWSPVVAFNLIAVAWSRYLKGKDLNKTISLTPNKTYEFE